MKNHNNRKSVLWLDDEPENFAYEIALFEMEDIELVKAISVNDAMTELSEKTFDLIILDQQIRYQNTEQTKQEINTFWMGLLIYTWIRLGNKNNWYNIQSDTNIKVNKQKIDSQLLIEMKPLTELYKTFFTNTSQQLANNQRNDTIPVCIVSGFHDDEVHKQYQYVDKLFLSLSSENDVPIRHHYRKPLSTDELSTIIQLIKRDR